MAVTITLEANFSGAVWTDISSYLESEVSISGGRQDELSQADANQCSFTLDNRDGRFTPGKTSGAYYPNVKVGVPVRVSVDLGGGSSRRFTGFVDSWQLDWTDGQDAAKVNVQASSVLARLGLLSERKSALEEEILQDSPVAYWPLSEPAGALMAYDESGTTNANLIATGSGAPFVFGNATGPSADGLTSAQFYGGQLLSGTINQAFGSPLTVEAFFSAASSAVTAGTLWLVRFENVSGGTGILINSATGNLEVATNNTAGTTVPGALDGGTHHIAVVWQSGTAAVYLDGQLVTSGAATTPLSSSDLRVGYLLGANALASPAVIGHVAIYGAALSASRIGDRYPAGMTGFRGETVSTRMSRYASWGKVSGYSTTSAMPVAADEYAGAAMVDLLQKLAETESGVLYDERDGTLTLKPRQTRLTATTAATFNAAADQLESAFQPVTDRQGLANEVTVTGSDGTVAKVTDTASQTAYGVARQSIETLTTEPQQPLARAQWEVYAHGTPRERVPTLAVDVLNCGITPSTLLGLTVWSRVAVTNPPSQAAGPGDYFIEGWSETFDPTSYVTTFNVSPAQPWVNTLILDDATKDVLDSTYVLA